MKPLYGKTKYDVENEIWEISNFAEMIKNFADVLYDGDYKYDQDDVHTTLHGVANLLIAHGEKMFLTHKKLHRLDEYKVEGEENV